MVTEIRADVVVVGGGLGGVAAALAAADAGLTVVLAEESDWLGGQLTSQAVPPDEHPWIEQFGCTARYRRLRDGLRAHYRRWYPLTESARSDPQSPFRDWYVWSKTRPRTRKITETFPGEQHGLGGLQMSLARQDRGRMCRGLGGQR